jgi:alpha-tubulin suppressor-like RCC1 family protein
VAVAGGLRFEQIASGQSRSCGLTADGTAWCWGNGTSGGLGDGASAQRYEPVTVAGGLKFRTLGVGGMATCGITADGTAYCWGENEVGAVGRPIVAH